MKNRKKVYIGIIAILAIILSSIICFNIFNKDEEVDTEILVSQRYDQVQKGDEAIDGTEYVTFDAFYLRDLDGDGYAEKLRGTCREIGTTDTLYMDLNVLTNGTLKDAKITINGKNFYFATALVKDTVISKDYISTNTKEIVLNDISNGTQKLIFGVVKSGDYTYPSNVASAIGNDIDNYSVTDNTITLVGTHVADDGTETPITKTIKLTNDWYGTTSTTIGARYQEYDINEAIDKENKEIAIKFVVAPNEVDNQLIIKNQHVELEIPDFMGYKATSVSISNSNAVLNYNPETSIATIDLDAVVNSSGVVTRSVGREASYTVTVTYPYEAYESVDVDGFSLNIPIDATYTGYNNKNGEFNNPYVSNVAEDVIAVLYEVPEGENSIIYITVGQYIDGRYVVSKEKPLNIYNNIESEDEQDLYNVKWQFSTGTEIIEESVILREQESNYTDKFLDVNSNYIDMLDYVDNVGIYFSNAYNLLGEDGYINVYNDETNELLHTFTNEDWNLYTSSNPYMYEIPVEHIRVETSKVINNTQLYVNNIKQIDDIKLTTDFTEEEFNNLSKIYSYLEGYAKVEGESEQQLIDVTVNYANYEMPYSEANLYIEPSTITNQETKKGVKLTITTDSNSYIKKKWTNGEFLLKYPDDIIDVKINSVTTTTSGVEITGVDTYEEDGVIYTKIYTSNNIEMDLNIVVNADITADPRKTTSTETVELYYYNPGCNNYYPSYITEDIYDINNDGNTEENVGKTSKTIDIIAPSNLLTSQIGIEFDDIGSVAVAPQEAIVDKSDNSRTAKVNVNITNNYSNTISELKIVGKIPFEGNTYLLNGSDMGSTFTTTMSESGIILPEDLKEYATVYYSYNEVVTEDINAKKNGWTTTPEDMSQVKSYLIDLGDYVLPVNDMKVFEYEIQIPSGIAYNEVSYSEHAVYYCLDTEQGKLKTQTEPNKLGFRIAEKFDMEITKYETNSSKVIPGTVFSVQEVDTLESTIATTNSNGTLIIEDLYVEKEYIVKEIKTNDNYILNTTETGIIGHIIDGELQIEILEGGFKNTPTIEVIENANSKVKIDVENEVKYNFVLNKTQTGTNDIIQGIRFELTDYNGKTKKYTTDKEGKLNIKLLEPNKQYTLTEIESKGHYLKDAVTFMMVRDENNNLKFNVLAGDLDTLPVIYQSGEVPLVTTGLKNEKIPTYSLRITKKEKDTETTIAGAQFKLTGENKADNVLYTTDENGVIQIDNLYQYVEGKNIIGEYSLQEIYPTEGYVLNDTPIVFKAEKDATDNLTLEITSGTIREAIEDVIVDNTNPDNPIINITIDNDPVFTLTKVDAETGEPLEGVEFKITDMNGNYVRDAEGNLVGATEVGKIRLSSTGNYPWTKNDDGIWQSGNYNIANSTSTLTSEEFLVKNNSIIAFSWSVSSEGDSKDYLYYSIKNLDTKKIIGGTTTQISGASLGYKYDDLIFNTVEEELNPGRYIIEFTYSKNSSLDRCLDRGYIKNVLLIDENKNIKTDQNGKIRLSLIEGLYKATETKALEGYALPETYTEIGIGASKEAEYDLEVDWILDEEKIGFKNIISLEDGSVVIGDKGSIIKFDLNGEIDWEDRKSEYIFNDLIRANNSIFVVGNGGKILNYNLNGEIIWEKTTSQYDYKEICAVNDGVIIAGTKGQILKYDFDGNIIWSNLEKDYNIKDMAVSEEAVIVVCESGKIVKYNLNGEFLWEKTPDDSCEYTGIAALNDGFVTVSEEGYIIYYDLAGNMQWELYNWTPYTHKYQDVEIVEDGIIAVGTISSYYNAIIEKYSFEGKEIWKKEEDGYKNYCKVSIYDNQIMVVNTDGDFIEYNNDGSIAYSNTEKSHAYNDMTVVEDGFIIVGDCGAISKYNFNGEFIWENTSTTLDYKKVIIVDDGIVTFGSDGYRDRINKFSFDGEYIKSIAGGYWDDLAAIDNGFVAVGSTNSGQINAFDLDGNEIYEFNSTSEYKYIASYDKYIIVVSEEGHIVKYDFDGNKIWENLTYTNRCGEIVLMDDGFVVLGKTVSKYDFDGNLLWINSDISDSYYDGIAVSDGIIAVKGYGNPGIVKYDYNGNIVWENVEVPELYNSLVKVEDGIVVLNNYSKLIKYKNHIMKAEVPPSTEILIENKIATYKITTEVEGQGGTISGIKEEPYEEVIYKENSVKDIIITPENGYKVKNITINGKEIYFEENDDKTVVLDKFIEMTEDKNITASFTSISNSLTINKTDSVVNTPLAETIFNIKQLETREEPSNEVVIGEMVANGNEYTEEVIILGEKEDNVLGNLTNTQDTYYFIEENGSYVPNNLGFASTTANSYIEIDLTNYIGTYAIVVNANISSEGGCDFGYATIRQDTSAPSYSSAEGQFMKISGTSSDVTTAKDYMKTLEGGNIYYLHLGYRKDSSQNYGDDKLTINSVNLYNAELETVTNIYNFIENENGGYESNNQGIASTIANSYIPIDLEGYDGKYNLIVNANVSCYAGDYGYATITNDIIPPEYTDTEGQFIKISGTSSSVVTPKDYTTILKGGQMYYLHFGYYKNSIRDGGDDKFTINSISLTLNQDDFVDTDITTNQLGNATIELIDGRYQITEVRSPHGYTLNSTPIIYDFVLGQENVVAVENDPQVDIIVHHYIKGTTTSVAPDETQKGDLGKEYTTSPKTDLIDYQLVKNDDGSYQIPDNATGIYTEETQVITYYYEVAPVQLIVHHYIDGTEDSVAPDVISEAEKGSTYTTSPVEYPTLDEKYELVTTKLPENASGTLEDSVTEVTYYYKSKKYNITTEVDGIGGTITGEGQTPYETVIHGNNSANYIKITADEGYQIKSITINGIKQYLSGKRTSYTLSKFSNVIEDKHIIATFEIETIEYLVTKVWEDNSNELEKRPKELEIQLYEENKLISNKILYSKNFIAETVKEGEIGFSQLDETYPWTKNEDGTWQSGNYNIHSTSSVLTSDVFEIEGEKKLTFEWSVSSESKSCDYLYYKITNIDTGATIGGNSSSYRIGGTSYGKVYENLNFYTVSVSLSSGNYKIEFAYRKDGSVNSGLDRGFIRNVIIGREVISNQWQTTFEVPLLDSSGNKINYSVVEKEVNTDDLYMYDSSITYGENEATITNTFSIPDTKVDIAATKTWVDNDNINLKRPSQIKLQLKNGDTVLQEQVLDVTTENTQSYTFTDLPEYDENGNTIEYTIDEVEVNTDDLKFYTKTVNNETYTITNTFTVPEDKVNVDVTKKWEDNSNANNVRPTQITLQVKNGDTVVQEKTVDVTSDNEKVYTFENLAKYDANGQEFVYTADEKEVDGYTKATDGTTVTNTIKSYKITTEVNGEGGIISGQDENPYEEVTHGGTSVKDITVTPDEGYEISKITINTVEQPLPENPTIPYTMDKFENVTEDKHVIVEFKKREYKITTEVEGVGGAITGEGETPYETVIYGENSVKDITATPDAGYKITSITVNGEPIELTPNDDDTYTLDKFVNMTEDKHIVVKFEKKDTSIIVKHQTEDGTDLIDLETVNGKVGDTYTTTEKDFEDYEIKTIPDNATGTMTEEQIEIIYIYSLVKGKITVTKVDINNTNTKLSGATFKLEKLDDNGNVDTTFTAQEKTTGSEGTVEFADLLVGKYQITETIAPEGYELNTEVTEVEVTKVNRESNVTVKNREKLVLPETGEINYTVIISVVGITVMSIALIILKTTRNKKEMI